MELGRETEVRGSSPGAEGFLVAEEVPGHLLSTAPGVHEQGTKPQSAHLGSSMSR